MLSSIIRQALVAGAFGCLSLSSPAFTATDDLYRDAEAHAARSDAAAMEASYDAILKISPDDTRALLGRATARAWASKHAEAQADYNKVLVLDPNNLEALTGIGYSFAWNKQYDDAERSFHRALAVAPENPGGQKGLGYTYLWSGRHQEALDVFQAASRRLPNDAELHVATGQALAGLGQRRKSRLEYDAALLIDPTRRDASDGLRALEDGRRYIGDLTIWVGSTSNGDSGLRSVEAALQPSTDWRIWARYDDSLSLDNPTLARSGADAESYFLGALHRFSPEWLGVLEVGHRELPLGADQQIYKGEIVRLDGTHTQKLGVQISPHSDGFTDELAYAAYGFAIADRWRMEPVVFYSNSGAGDDNEWRGVVNLEFAGDGWSAGFSAGGGVIESDLAANDGSVFVASARVGVTVFEHHELQGLVRYEDAPSNEYTTAMVGFTFRLPAD